jgi:hypothetical protein
MKDKQMKIAGCLSGINWEVMSPNNGEWAGKYLKTLRDAHIR